jgi:hypothetical protein
MTHLLATIEALFVEGKFHELPDSLGVFLLLGLARSHGEVVKNLAREMFCGSEFKED